MSIRGILALLAGEDGEPTAEEDVAHARRELDAALEALRRARAEWATGDATDPEVLRKALDQAERQLDAARVRLHRALSRHR